MAVSALSNAPCLPTHYQPETNGYGPKNSHHAICLAASTPYMFPETFLPTTIMLIIDTGASISISNNKADFIEPSIPVQPTLLQGIASGLTVQGIGTVQYTFTDETGSNVTVHLPNTLYVPACAARLLCPRHLAASTTIAGDGFTSLHTTATLRCHGRNITAAYNEQTGLPIIIACIPQKLLSLSAQVATTIPSPTVPCNTKPNLSNSQRLKLLWHERCNHRSMSTINNWIRQGLLPVDASIASTPDPICAACQAGKAHRRSHAKVTNTIAAPCTYPGQQISADQLEAGYPGRIPTAKGMPTHKRYKYCNLWIDNYSRFIYPAFHETKHAADLVASKREFLAYAKRFNVTVQSIRADNGVYSAGQFQVSCLEDNQELTFCAVGSHWQNGVAERAIGSMMQMARTILIHAITQWPGVLSEEFWAFALRHACNFHNASIDPDIQQSPYHLFTGAPAPWRLQDFRVFGCPVFVLDKKLQDGDSLPEWKSRCWTGVYVGQSLQHAGSIPLIYNPRTTHVTPQYHLTFDDQFTTVKGSTAIMPESEYLRLYHNTDWMFPYAFGEQADLHLFDTYWSNPPPVKLIQKKQPDRPRYTKRIPKPDSPPEHCEHSDTNAVCPADAQPSVEPSASADAGARADASTPADASARADANLQVDASQLADAGARADASEIADDHTTATTFTCHKPYSTNSITSAGLETLPYINLCSIACSAALQEYQQLHGLNATVYVATSTVPYIDDSDAPAMTVPSGNILSPLAPTAAMPTISTPRDNKNDILTQGQMFKAQDVAKFIACQQDEINALYDLDIMDALPISSLPPKARLLCSIWSYRQKRLPNGVFLKYKARLCVNGKEQAFGHDYWETYAPVAAWSTIRLLLYLSTILDLHTKQVDYTSAFPQADLDVPVYMRVPQGWYVKPDGRLAQHKDPKFQDKDHYLKLKKNLYGCKQAARNWFKKLSEGLLKEGFVQTKTDSCLFMRHDCLIIVYVDDCLFFSPNKSTINSVIASLSTTFKLKDEGDVSAFLGVQINKDRKAKTVSFSQPGLIDQLI
jgi:hypothetical protein